MDEIWTAIRDQYGPKLDEIRAKVEEKINAVREWINQRRSEFQSSGENLILGLKDGILAKAGEIIAATLQLIRQVVGAARAAIEESSPSRVFMRMGVHVGEGLAIGITKSTSLAVKSVKDMANRVVGAMKPIKQAMKFDEIAATSEKIKAAASDIFVATGRKEVWDMRKFSALGRQTI